MKIWLFSLCFSINLFAQIPETDIWLFKIIKKENNLLLTQPLNITNRIGYDNQPTFTEDGKSILYVSIDSTKQADVYQYNISKKTKTNLTNSDVSEYSPTLMPDYSGFSCVVVEKDSTQRIWNFNHFGKFLNIVHENTDSVGYHTWLNKDTLLYYKLTNPHSLRALDVKTNNDIWIANNPSRAFKKINNSSKFIYAIKQDSTTEFRIYNPILKESIFYCLSNTITEDFIWHPEFGLIRSENSNLCRFNEQNQKWETLFSFSNFGIQKITRFVFDLKSKQIAIVNNLIN
jgi:hypothetical protein